MAAIKPVLVLSGDVSGVVSGLRKIAITWKLGMQPEDCSYELLGPAASVLTPGRAPNGLRIVGISLNGGTTIHARMLSTGAMIDSTIPATVSEQGKSVGSALEDVPVARQTAQQIRFADVFIGAKGTIQTTSGGLLSGTRLPGWNPIQNITVADPETTALLGFTWVIDPSVQQIPIDADINQDTLAQVTINATQRLASYVDPQRAQAVIDSGDVGVAGELSQTITIGHLGGGPGVHFNNLDIASTFHQPIMDGSQFQGQVLQMCQSASFKGGDTHHGLPPGGVIRDALTINNLGSDATGNYRSGMLIVAIYGDRNNGGVYFWPGDGALHPMSQAMGVTSLWYDESLQLIYAGTDAGVYQHSPDPDDKSPWKRLGSFSDKVIRVMSSLGRVYALCENGQTGARAVYMYAGPGTGLTAPKGLGFDGWIDVYDHAGLQDFCVVTGTGDTAVSTIIYAISSGNTGYVLRKDISPGSTGQILPIPIGGDPPTQVAIGLDPLVNSGSSGSVLGGSQTTISSLYVRTDSGSDGLYTLDINGTLQRAGMGLESPDGTPVMVNQVRQHLSGVMSNDTSSTSIQVMAATSNGIYACSSAAGNAWKRTDGQNNLGDLNMTIVASAPPRAWLGSVQTHVFGLTDRNLYTSRDAMVTWLDALNEPLDKGPVFFALWKKRYGTYPDNVSTTLTINVPLGGTFQLRRELDGLGNFSYITENLQVKSPTQARRIKQYDQLSTAAMVPEIPMSELLLDAEIRFLMLTSRPQEVVTIRSEVDDDSDPLLRLRPTHQCLVSGSIATQFVGMDGTDGAGTPVVYVTFNGEKYYVLEHTIEFDADSDPLTYSTTTRLGKICLEDVSGDDAMLDDLFYTLSRQSLYKRGK